MSSARARVMQASVVAALASALACGKGEADAPDPQRLRLPTGALLSPDGGWLFVTNSNLDLGVQASTLVALDMRALDRAFDEPPLDPGDELSAGAACRTADDVPGELDPDVDPVVECEARFFIQRDHTVRLPSGAGNIALDLPAGEDGPWRLLVPSSLDRAVTWIDVIRDGSAIDVDCNQDAGGECAASNRLTHRGDDPASTRLPRDPARIYVDTGGFRYAYLPHLLGNAMTLIALDAEYGPQITDVRGEFWRESPANPEFAGGFAVAQRACDPARPASLTMSCQRPLLYATHRFWPGLKQVSVETGGDVLVASLGSHSLLRANPAMVEDRPFMGDLEFEDPQTGERLLAVHTTPPSLTLVDTRLDDDDRPINDPIDSVSLCRNPNVLAVHRPAMGERMAFVSCYSDDQVAAVALGSFRVVGTIDVDDGPNELVVDEARRKLYVVHTLASTVGVIELDRTSPRYLRLIRRIGLRDG